MRRTRAAIFVAAAMAAGLSPVPGAVAQTTTTMPPVRSIPVTPGPTTATTAAPTTGESAGQGGTAAADLADTGVAADKLVPLGLLLIGLGAALQGAARRRSYGLL